MQAGWIGLGGLGAAMARRLAERGLLAGAWNRTRARGEKALTGLSTTLSQTPVELARHCRLLFLCLADDTAVQEVMDSLEAELRPGTVVVDVSTTAPATSATLARRLATRGAQFVDAPVSGGVEGARTGALVLFVGGSEAALLSCQPAFAALASRVAYLGRPGQGQAAKAVNQVLVAGINQAVTEALALADALGLPGDVLRPALNHGMAGNRLLERRGEALQAGHFAPGFRLALHHKDLTHAQALARELGAQLPLVEMTLIHYRRLMAEGASDLDITALYRQKQRLFPGSPGSPGDSA